LARELQLEVKEPADEPSIVATPVGMLPLDLFSLRRILRFPLTSWSGKLRTLALFGRVLFNRRSHIADLSALARMDRGGTIESWGKRTLGDTAYDYILRSGVEPFFYFGAHEASSALGKALLRHAIRWRTLVLTGGSQALCDALARRLEVRTGCVAGTVEVGDSAVRVDHSGGRVEADYAILAAPAPVLAGFEGSLAEEDRADLKAVRYVPSIVVFFGYERPITVRFPSVIPAGPKRHAIARVRTTSNWVREWVPEGKELIAIYASGWRSAELLDAGRDRMTATLRADAEEVFGRLADPDWVRVYPRREGIVLPIPGHSRRMQAFQRRPRGRLLFAGDWMTGSTIEGAVRSGLAAASRILEQG
jgi:predicted NAD/FAD-dependent oxidoreductase